MIIIFFGHLGETIGGNLLGRSNESGFKITHKKGHPPVSHTFTSPGYKEMKTSFMPEEVTVLLLIATFVFSFWVGDRLAMITQLPKMGIRFSILLCLNTFSLWFLVSLISRNLYDLLRLKHIREWHACEHKACVIIRAQMKPTIETLRRMPKTIVTCGFVWIFVAWEFVSSITLYSWSTLIPGPASWYLKTISITMGWSAGVYLVIAFLGYGGSKIMLLLFPLFLPAITTPLILEHLLVLKKPSEEKLHTTTMALQGFQKQKQQSFRRKK